MPKIKTFLLLTLVLVFSISLFGCGLFLPDTAAPEELTGQDGELPEWLLAAHRDVEIEGTEISDDLPEEDDLAIGGTDEDDGFTAPSAVQETPAQPAATNTPAPAPAPAPSPACKPGTTEYLIWFQETGGNGDCAEWWAEVLEEKAKAEAEADTADWFEGSPSGWGDE